MADYEGKFAFSKTATEVQPKAEPLKLETPMSGAGIKMQEPVDFNLAK
jgi:hypothetical protein